MAIINVNSLTGSDELGAGSVESPFESVNRAIQQALPGDIILILGEEGHVHSEPDTIVIADKTNIKIQSEPLRNIRLRPRNVSHGASILISNSDGANISGLIFMSSEINGTYSGVDATHSYAIHVRNSSNVKILGNEISSDWECHDTAATELFKFHNSSVEATGNFCKYIEVSYPSLNAEHFFSFISLSGNGNYLIRNSAIERVHANSAYAYGLKVYRDCGNFVIDDFSAREFLNEYVDYDDKMIGMLIEFDASPPEYTLKNITLDKLGYGIKFKSAGRSVNTVIKRMLITNCKYAGISLNDNSHVHSVRGITIAKCGVGIHASHNSYGEFYNAILFKNHTALRSEVNANIAVKYAVYYENTNYKFQNNGGIIDTSQFVRNIDPRFVNENEDNYALTDFSPCVDMGFLFQGDSYLGSGPDIGFFEKSGLITEDDLPALLARASRLSESVPLTEIDITGMIAKGIETSDGRILASREGSAVKDVAVKPLDLLIAPYHTELELIRDRLSFDRLENLSYQDADLLAANVFVKRDYGNLASGIIRIFFTEPRDAIIYAEHEFETRDRLKFYNRATVAITKEEMALNYSNGTYYFDIIVDAEAAHKMYNLPPESISISTMPMPPGTLGFSNPYEISGGFTEESNIALKEKARYGITVRDVVTKKGARAILPELFPAIQDMRVIGYRDREMERDYISLISDHIGGKTDVYVKMRQPVDDFIIVYPDSKYFEINDASFSGYVPILRIRSIELLTPVSEAETGIFLTNNSEYKLINRDKLVRYSAQEKLALEFSDEVVANNFPNTPLKITFTWVPEIKPMQRVIEGNDERVVVADILVKTLEPAYANFAMAYHAVEELPGLESGLRAFVRGLPAGTEIQVSDLIAVAYSLGAQKVIQPMELSVMHHDRFGETHIITSPDGVIIPRVATYWDGDINTYYMGKDIYEKE